MHPKRSNFIVFEGLPGSGKSTFSRRASQELGLHELGNVFHPSVRERYFAFSSKYSRSNELIKCDIARSSNSEFILDRNYLTVLGYAFLKSPELYSETLEWYLSHRDIDLIAPRAYVIFDLPSEHSVVRRQKVAHESLWTDKQFLDQFNSFYLYFLERYESTIPVYWVDALKPLCDVWTQILEIFSKEHFGLRRNSGLLSQIHVSGQVSAPAPFPPVT